MNKDTVTGQRDYIRVPRTPTKEMVNAAWSAALAEDAASVWESMIEEYENQTSRGKSGGDNR